MPATNLAIKNTKGEHTLEKESLEAEIEKSYILLLQAARKYPELGITDDAYILNHGDDLIIIINSKGGYCYLEIDTTMREKDRVGIFRFVEENEDTEKAEIEILTKSIAQCDDEMVYESILSINPEMFGSISRGHAIHTLLKVFASNEIRSQLISMCNGIEYHSLKIWNALLKQTLRN